MNWFLIFLLFFSFDSKASCLDLFKKKGSNHNPLALNKQDKEALNNKNIPGHFFSKNERDFLTPSLMDIKELIIKGNQKKDYKKYEEFSPLFYLFEQDIYIPEAKKMIFYLSQYILDKERIEINYEFKEYSLLNEVKVFNKLLLKMFSTKENNTSLNYNDIKLFEKEALKKSRTLIDSLISTGGYTDKQAPVTTLYKAVGNDINNLGIFLWKHKNKDAEFVLKAITNYQSTVGSYYLALEVFENYIEHSRSIDDAIEALEEAKYRLISAIIFYPIKRSYYQDKLMKTLLLLSISYKYKLLKLNNKINILKQEQIHHDTFLLNSNLKEHEKSKHSIKSNLLLYLIMIKYSKQEKLAFDKYKVGPELIADWQNFKDTPIYQPPLSFIEDIEKNTGLKFL